MINNSAYEGVEQIVVQQHPQFLPMLSCVLMNRLRDMPIAASVEVPLSDLSPEHWMSIGQSFSSSLVSSTTPSIAVEEWILRYPALRELDSTHAWFRPMVNEIAKTLLAEASWGARVRLYAGAGLSMLDMVSDMYVIVLYWGSADEADVGNTLFAFLLANIAWQLLNTSLNYWRAPLRVLLWEMFYVLSCAKVGVDAYRVAAGVEQEAYTIMDSDMELSE
jgi:hypothetical protein